MIRKNACAALLVLVLGAGLASVSAPAHSDMLPTIGVASLLDHMNENGSTVQSGRLLLRNESTYSGVEGDTRTEVHEAEVWFDGVRVRLERRATTPDSFREQWTVFDGERVTASSPPDFARAAAVSLTDLSKLRHYVSLATVRTVMHWPLDAACTHQQPFGERLRSWSTAPLQLVTMDRVGDLPCYVLLVPPVSAGSEAQVTQRLWVAPQRGYAVAKFEQDFAISSGEPVSRVRIVDEVGEWLHPIEGLWLPKVVTSHRYHQDRATGEEKAVRTEQSQVISATFNTPIPDEVFQIDLPDTTPIVLWGE